MLLDCIRVVVAKMRDQRVTLPTEGTRARR